MKTDQDKPASSVDDGIKTILSASKDRVMGRVEKWEDAVRKHPVESVLGALAAGFIIHSLPLRSILIAKFRLFPALAPPALLAYGAAKLCEILQRKGTAPSAVGGFPREERF